MEEVKITIFTKALSIVISFSMLTFECSLRSLAFIMVAVLAHSFSIILKILVRTLGNLLSVLSEQNRLFGSPVNFSDNEH